MNSTESKDFDRNESMKYLLYMHFDWGKILKQKILKSTSTLDLKTIIIYELIKQIISGNFTTNNNKPLICSIYLHSTHAEFANWISSTYSEFTKQNGIQFANRATNFEPHNTENLRLYAKQCVCLCAFQRTSSMRKV